ncbi:hypothetical protein Hypma_007857 [Hypsizygus marmoreus]|uniref:Uncharacterized protein n=1 Tax=Hypsizygus marmoreus TaxID=39966 RepID=A0A369JX87_HYPMA|nr:hypothetical protein Hypma_007857 [Hypsizygus marmoreus]
MSLLGIIFGGVLSIVLWFEVASTPDMTSGERAGFVVAGLVETFLFVASILGFVGAIVRKQLFVQIYAYFIYVHFLLNIAIAGYLLYVVTHFSANATVKACQETIQNQQAKEQCTGLLKIARGVYFVVAAIVLLVELYVALIITRYVNQVKTEKRTARESRLDNEEAFSLVSKGKGRYSSLPGGHSRGLSDQSMALQTYSGPEYDPYDELRGTHEDVRQSFVYDGVPSLPIDVGYGGGSWTHSEITQEEKARLQRRDAEEDVLEPVSYVDDEERVHRMQESKSSTGPPSAMRIRELDDLPRYTLSDPPRGSG